HEGVAVVAQAHVAWQLLQPRRVAAADHYVVGLKSGLQIGDHLIHGFSPFLAAEALAAALADIVLEGAALLVGHVPDLRGFHHAIDDERRAETGAEPEKQHAPAAITADRLHGRIVDEAHRLAERPGE